MRIISFAWTTPAFLANRKTRTRRDWNDDYAKTFKKGQLVAAYDRLARIGGKQIGIIELTETPFKEFTCKVQPEDWELEGFAYLESIGVRINGHSPAEFWKQWLNSNKQLWVISFRRIKL